MPKYFRFFWKWKFFEKIIKKNKILFCNIYKLHNSYFVIFNFVCNFLIFVHFLRQSARHNIYLMMSIISVFLYFSPVSLMYFFLSETINISTYSIDWVQSIAAIDRCTAVVLSSSHAWRSIIWAAAAPASRAFERLIQCSGSRMYIKINILSETINISTYSIDWV